MVNGAAQPKPLARIRHIAPKQAAKVGQVFKELGFAGERSRGHVDPKRVLPRPHARVQHLNGGSLGDLSRLVNQGARGVLAVTRLAGVAGQRPVGRGGVALLLNLAAKGDELSRKRFVHRLHNGFGGIKTDACLLAACRKSKDFRACIAEHQFVQGYDRGKCSLSRLAWDKQNDIGDPPPGMICLVPKPVHARQEQDLERLQDDGLARIRSLYMAAEPDKLQDVLGFRRHEFVRRIPTLGHVQKPLTS